MNDIIDTEPKDNNELQGAFGDRGTNLNALNFGHPYAESIIDRAKEVLCESKTGKLMVSVMDKHKVPVHVMKGKQSGATGFSPEAKIIYLSVPGNIDKATGEVMLDLAKALREVDMEYAGMKTPKPTDDLLKYAAFIHARNLDSLITTCKIVKELINTPYYTILLDSMGNLGLNRFYKACIEGKPRDELYDYYAEAYN